MSLELPWRILAAEYRKRMKKAHPLILAGIACWIVVILTHVAEHWHMVPAMGWGLPNSPGHYLDLFSAIAGALLLAAAFIRAIF